MYAKHFHYQVRQFAFLAVFIQVDMLIHKG